MKKKALTLAIAAALSAPASFAATDDSGMRYTSASEGFYGTVTTDYSTKSVKGGKGSFGGETRIGVRGTNDMGGGLEGFYRWEGDVSNNDKDSGFASRLGTVGLRGGFGQVQFGSFWTADINWVYASLDRASTTEVSNTYYSRQREGRSQAALEYTTPDLNGFQGAFRLSADEGGDAASGANSVGLWNIASKYSTHGFTVAASYNVIKDGIGGRAAIDATTATPAVCQLKTGLGAPTAGTEDETTPNPATGRTCADTHDTIRPAVDTADALPALGTTDLKSWGASLAYAQNNWDVAVFYGVDNTSDDKLGVAAGSRKGGGCGALASKKCKDRNILALSGAVSIDKIRLIASWEKVEQEDGSEDVDGGLTAQYNFTPITRLYADYRIRDFDTNPNRENQIRVGMRHAF